MSMSWSLMSCVYLARPGDDLAAVDAGRRLADMPEFRGLGLGPRLGGLGRRGLSRGVAPGPPPRPKRGMTYDVRLCLSSQAPFSFLAAASTAS